MIVTNAALFTKLICKMMRRNLNFGTTEIGKINFTLHHLAFSTAAKSYPGFRTQCFVSWISALFGGITGKPQRRIRDKY